MQPSRPPQDIGPEQIDLLLRAAQAFEGRRRRGAEGAHQGHLPKEQGQIRRPQGARDAEERGHRRQPQKGTEADERDVAERQGQEAEIPLVQRPGRPHRRQRNQQGLRERRAEQEMDDGRVAVQLPVRQSVSLADPRHGGRRHSRVGPVAVAEPRADQQDA